MMEWELVVDEEAGTYVYNFDTWADLVSKLSSFDGLAVEYCIYRTRKGDNK